VRIEYSTALLHQLGRERTNGDTTGVLYGVRRNNDLRVITASKSPGLEAIGVFATRVRGEVFLTESDLSHWETVTRGQGISLVVAGERAGFFVRQAGGSLQTIQSYQEFPVAGSPPRTRRLPPWGLIALEACAVGAMTLAWPASHTPPVIAVRTERGQLCLAWQTGRPGALEIRDGFLHTIIPVTAALTSTTYMPRTDDVEVRASWGGSVRFLGYGKTKPAR
jgi:hypothetical protein